MFEQGGGSEAPSHRKETDVADYTLTHPVWDNVSRVAQGAEERDRYMQAGWVLKDPPKTTRKTPPAEPAEAQDPAVTETEKN